MWLVLRTIKGFINLWNNFFFLFMIKKTSTFIWINAFHIICPKSHFWRFLVSNRCCKTSLFSFVLFYLSRQIGFLHYVFIWVWISFHLICLGTKMMIAIMVRDDSRNLRLLFFKIQCSSILVPQREVWNTRHSKRKSDSTSLYSRAEVCFFV